MPLLKKSERGVCMPRCDFFFSYLNLTLKLIVSESACRRFCSQFLSGHKIQPLKQIMQHKIHHVLSAYGTTEHFAAANQYNQPCNTLPLSCTVHFNTQQRGVTFSVKIWKKNIGLAGGAWATTMNMPEPGYFSSPFCVCIRRKLGKRLPALRFRTRLTAIANG